GQLPEEPRVDRAERQLAALSRCSRTFNIVQQPADLAAGEVGVDHQAGLLLDGLEVTLLAEFIAELGGAAILPDDGIVNRPAGAAIPDHGGLALVGNADGSHFLGRLTVTLQPLGGHRALGVPDLFGVVLDVAAGGENLREFLLSDGADRSGMVEKDGPRTRCSLIEREDE